MEIEFQKVVLTNINKNAYFVNFKHTCFHRCMPDVALRIFVERFGD